MFLYPVDSNTSTGDSLVWDICHILFQLHTITGNHFDIAELLLYQRTEQLFLGKETICKGQKTSGKWVLQIWRPFSNKIKLSFLPIFTWTFEVPSYKQSSYSKDNEPVAMIWNECASSLPPSLPLSFACLSLGGKAQDGPEVQAPWSHLLLRGHKAQSVEMCAGEL